MRPTLPGARTLVSGLLALGLSATTFGLSSRVFVSPLGKDSTTCGTLLMPCKTFAGGVAQVTPGGIVVALLPGDFGPVTITKALTIEAPSGLIALVQTGGTAITINAGSNDIVTLRGLSLASTSHSAQGILVNSAGGVHIEKCTISNFVDAIAAFSWPTGRLFVTDTTARGNDQGLRATASPGPLDITVERGAFESNNNGIVVQDGTRAAVRGSVASGNIAGLIAQAAFGGNVELTVTDCLVTYNTGSGVTSEGDSGSALVRVSGSTVTGNQRGLVQATFGGTSTFLSRGDNTVEGNPQGDLAGAIQIDSGK